MSKKKHIYNKIICFLKKCKQKSALRDLPINKHFMFVGYFLLFGYVSLCWLSIFILSLLFSLLHFFNIPQMTSVPSSF